MLDDGAFWQHHNKIKELNKHISHERITLTIESMKLQQLKRIADILESNK